MEDEKKKASLASSKGQDDMDMDVPIAIKKFTLAAREKKLRKLEGALDGYGGKPFYISQRLIQIQ